MCATMNYDMIAMYKESYDFMTSHPMVKQLKKENKKLRKEVSHLKTMLMITQENMRMMMEIKKTNKKSKKSLEIEQPLSQDDIYEDPNGCGDPYCMEWKCHYLRNHERPKVKTENTQNNKYEVVEENDSDVEIIDKPHSEIIVIDDNILEVSQEVVETKEVEVEETEEVEVEETEEVEVEVEETEEVEVEVEETEEVEVEETEEVEVEETEEVEVEETEEVEVEEVEETEEVEVEETEEVEEPAENVKMEVVEESTETAAEEEEVFMVEINGKEYYTDNDQNGKIYDVDDEGEINMEVGKFENGVVKFY